MMQVMLSLSLLIPMICSAWAQAQDQGCSVKINAPSNQQTVGETGDVSGTGAIPAGTYLWVFDHRKGIALWWPQGGGSAVITRGSWDVLANFGLDRDNGSQFEIVAVVVDQKTNDELLNWVKGAEETGRYPGMELPHTVAACRLEQVTVTKH